MLIRIALIKFFKKIKIKKIKSCKLLLKIHYELIFDVKFVKILKNGKIPPHTDPRKVAINIPVIVNKNQKICIYENKGGVDVENQPDGNRRLAKRYIPGEVIETFVSDKVFCLNTEATHGVINDGDKDRVVLSLKLKDKYDDYNLIKNMYNNGQLI